MEKDIIEYLSSNWRHDMKKDLGMGTDEILKIVLFLMNLLGGKPCMYNFGISCF